MTSRTTDGCTIPETPAPNTEESRTCCTCHKPLTRRHNERLDRFLKRAVCNTRCALARYESTIDWKWLTAEHTDGRLPQDLQRSLSR